MSRQPTLPGLAIPAPAAVPIPPRLRPLAEIVRCHRDPHVHARLRRLAARLHDEPHLLDLPSDPDVRAVNLAARAVTQDEHRAKAFVRFREVKGPDGATLLCSFYRPDHDILARVAPFFRDRFGSERFSIVTPDRSVSWDGRRLHFGPGAPDDPHAPEAAVEELWRAYYRAVFNPARSDAQALDRHLPRRYREQLPEADLARDLLNEAAPAVTTMLAGSQSGAAPFVPAGRLPLAELAAAARSCTGCPLHAPATQTVFGEGRASAPLMLIGEQPGDVEDTAGRPFVGPAGQLLDRALASAGIDRTEVYVTNAVKHFHHEPRHGMRLHKKPSRSHVVACRPWLDAELATVRPQVIVCLGATAAQALLGPAHRLADSRGRVLPSPHARALLTTYHPSAILRAEDPAAAAALFEALVTDLRTARGRLGGP